MDTDKYTDKYTGKFGSTDTFRRATLVYVAGPYSKGSIGENIHFAVRAANALRREGYAVIVPHSTIIEDIVSPHMYESWLYHALQLVTCCDVICRIVGESPGADVEVRLARKLGIPVYYNIEELIRNEKVWRERVRPTVKEFRPLSDALREKEEAVTETNFRLPYVRAAN